MTRKKELLKNTVIIMFGKLCTQLISFLMLPLYTSYLLTDDYGYIDLVSTYISLLVPILSLQLEMAVFRFLIDARKDNKKKNEIISTNVTLITLFSIVSLILFFIFNLFIHIKFAYIIITIIIVNIFSGNFMQISRGLGNNIDFSIASIISGGASVILNVLFIVVLKLGAVGMLYSMLIANILSTIYLFIRLKLYKVIKYKNSNKNMTKELITYSLPLIPNGISWWIMNVSDRTIISIFLGVAANGIYAVSNKFPIILSSIFNVFNLSWSESVSVSINDEDKDEYVSSVFNDSIKIFGCIGLLIISGLPIVFDFLVGKKYIDSYNYIPLLILGTLFGLLSSQYGSIYIATKQTKKLSKTTIYASILNLIINVVFIKCMGLYAAALSTIISYLIITLYRHKDIKKYVNVKYNISNITILIELYLLIISMYYINISIINYVSLILCILFCYLYNKELLFSLINKIKNKYLKRK